MRRDLTRVTAGRVVVAATAVGMLALTAMPARADPPAGPPGAAPTTTQGVSITVEVPGGTPSPTASPTASPTTASPTPAAPAGGGSGTLAKTGERIALVAGIGLTLFGVGVVVRVLARRQTVGGTP